MRNRELDSAYPLVILETGRRDRENKDSFLFDCPRDVLTFSSADSPDKFFKQAQKYLDRGFWLAGYFAYEFGYFLDPALRNLRRDFDFPLAWFLVCQRPRSFKSQGLGRGGWQADRLKPNIPETEYAGKIKAIKEYLSDGLTYQVNLTFKIKFDFSGDPFSFYRDMRRQQPTAYNAFIDTGQLKVISCSPELFFRLRGSTITARPMKGTRQAGGMKKCPKSRAENLMIVDLLRNDLGRFCDKVWVPKLFSLEKYPTLYQMTSTIKGRVRPRAKPVDVFTALFPCGSVTGAPKIAAMRMIQELEKEPRRVYCGAIGYISPKNQACFSVAIRTALLDNKGKGELGVGGGIIYDSRARSEYQEAMLKSRFFFDAAKSKFPKYDIMRKS